MVGAQLRIRWLWSKRTEPLMHVLKIVVHLCLPLSVMSGRMVDFSHQRSRLRLQLTSWRCWVSIALHGTRARLIEHIGLLGHMKTHQAVQPRQ